MMYSSLDVSSSFSLVGRRRKVVVITFATCLCFLLLLASSRQTYSPKFNATSHVERLPKWRHVAIASHFAQHFDVHLAVAHTIRQVLGTRGKLDVFASTPPRHGFQEVVDSLGLYDRSIRHPDEFMEAVRFTPSHAVDQENRMIDLVLFGTCEIDMNRWSDELLAIWDSRPRDQKFKVVCIVHHFRDTKWQEHIAPWSARGAIRLLPIGYHVGRTFRAHFQELADSTEPEVYTSLFEYIDIDVHAPVLDLPEYGQRRTPSMPSRAAIQGNFQIDRRDYPHIFADLLEALKDDPTTWGYHSLEPNEESYTPLVDPAYEPFQLHLIGEGHLDIPRELSNVVVIHNGLDYIDFYTLMQSMDIVIPTFVNKDYYDYQASSTVAMAVQCNIPILASRRMRTAYGYIDDDRVSIVRPQALREVHAIGAFRGARHYLNVSNSNVSDDGPGYRRYEQDVRSMLDRGWRRSPGEGGFNRFKSELWEKNREAIWRVLNDLPGEL